MKSRYSVKWMLVGALLSTSLTACSFGGDEEEQAEEVSVDENGEENAAVAEGEEGAENANAENAENVEGAENGNVAANAEGGNFENAEGGNAAAENNFSNSEIPAELLNAENSGAPAEGNLALDPNAANPALDPNAAAAALDPNAAAAAAPAPAAGIPASGDMRVYYVSVASASLKSSPDAAGQAVGSLSKGDPVLVKIEGEWANVVNRGYVEIASLSQSPVGRDVAPRSWH